MPLVHTAVLSAALAAPHLPTSTRQEFGAMPSAVGVMLLEGVSRLRHPPLSTTPSGVWIGSYSAQDSYALTVPCTTRGDTSIAHSTAARRLKTLTTSRCFRLRVAASAGFIRKTQ